MGDTRKFIDWTLESVNPLGEYVEYEYEIEYDFTPGEPDFISGPPEKCYQGHAEEFEVIDIFLCRDGQRTKLDPKNWEAAGFTEKEFDRMADEVREIFCEKEESRYDEDRSDAARDEAREPLDQD